MTTENGESQALMLRPEQGMVNVDFALEQWNAYQELTRKLLNETDYQKIGKTKFKKKSAWRKYARAFNISCEVVREDIERAMDYYPEYARVVVRASDPSGRFQEADGECHVLEKCCDKPCKKARWDDHFCCKADCTGRIHFSHPGDLVQTATTRAKNRAISDLIGAGEVSAEEVEREEDRKAPAQRATRTPPPPPQETRPAPPSAAPAEADPEGCTQTQANAIMKILGKSAAPDDWLRNNVPDALDGNGNYSVFSVQGSLTKAQAQNLIKQMQEAEAL